MKYPNENPILKLRPGEPYFFLRAQDCLSIDILKKYYEMLIDNDDIDGAASMLRLIEAFEKWQKEHPELVKFPD